MGCTDQSKQHAAGVNKNYKVCHKIPWKSTRIYRPETFASHSPLTVLFLRPFLAKQHRGRAKYYKLFLSEALVVIDTTGVVLP